MPQTPNRKECRLRQEIADIKSKLTRLEHALTVKETALSRMPQMKATAHNHGQRK